MKEWLKKLFPHFFKYVRVAYVRVAKFIKTIRNLKYWFVIALMKLSVYMPKLNKVYKNFESKPGRFISFEEYMEKYPECVELLFKNTQELSYCPPTFFDDRLPSNKTKSGINYTQYAAIIKSGIIIGGSDLIILKDSNVLYNLKTIDTENRYLYTDGGIKYYTNNSLVYSNRRKHLSLASAIWLGGNFTWNYYHFMYECLIKFVLIKDLNIDTNIPIVIDKVCNEIPQFRELIGFLNIENREIITLGSGNSCKVDRLFYIFSPNIIPPNLKNDKDMRDSDLQFNKESVIKLRCMLLKFKSDKSFPNRVFISRKNASSRRKFNEDDVLSVLKKYNFVEVAPEEYSVSDQMSLFHGADFIAGGSGAAFTNLLFCKSSSKALIFAKAKLPFSGFSSIADFIGMELKYFINTSQNLEGLDSMHDSFTINTKELDSYLFRCFST